MSTTEKLFVQLFDQKRQIIEELNHQKQLYDKYLLSKLLIRDISPPPWLLNFDSHSSTSDLNAYNKEDLLKGLLLPRHGPFTSYPTGPYLLYEKPPIIADNNGIPDETCTVKSASSNGIDEDGVGVAPLCQVDGTEDTADIASMCHTDGTEDMADIALTCHVDGTEDMADIAPVCKVDGTEDTTGVAPKCQVDVTEDSADIFPMCQVDDTEDMARVAPMCQVDGTKDTFEVDGIEDVAEVDVIEATIEVNGTNGIKGTSVNAPMCQADSKDDTTVIDPMSQVDGTEDTAGIAPTCQVDVTEDMVNISPPCQLGGTEDTSGVAPPSHVDGSMDTSSYVLMSPEDQIETRLSNICQLELSHARLHRSRSRQKALERRNSEKTSAKSRLGTETNVDISSGSKICRYDEQLDGFKESLELAEPSALPTKICSNKEVAVGNSLKIERSNDACGVSLAQSTGRKAKEVKSGVSEMEKNSSVYGGKITRSRSSSRRCISTHSGSETYRFDKLLDGSSGSLELDVPSRLPTEICFKEQGATGILSDKERSFDAYKASFSHSTINDDKEVDIRDSQKTEEHSKIYGNRISKSISCQESDVGAPLFEKMSDKVCVGRPTRSRSGKTQRSEIGVGNTKDCRITGSTSNGQHPVREAYPLGKKINETYVGRMTRSRSGKTQLAVNEMGNNKACSGKVTKSRSCEADESKLRSKSRKESVKPKQLDFDEVEDTNLCNIPFHFSDASLSDVKEVSVANLPELEAELNMLPDFKFSHAMDGSWPKYKRRKIEYQNFHKSASPTVRMNPFHDITDNLPSTSAQAEKANITLSSQHSSNSDNSVAALSNPVVLPRENNWSISSLNKKYVLTPQIQCDKYQVSSGRPVMASTCEHLKLPKYDGSNARHSIILEPSDSLPEDGEVKEKPPSAVLISGMVSDGLLNGQDVVDGDTASKPLCTEGALDQTKSPQRIDVFKFSISPSMEHMNLSEADKAMPEFEGFVIGDNTVDSQNSQDEFVHKEIPFPSSIMDRTSLAEQFCKSASMSTPVSPFPTACKLYLAPGMYSSVPNGFLENNDGQNNDIRSKLLHRGTALLGKSHSDLFSFPGSQNGWDNRKPFLSPMGNAFEGITSKSGGSSYLGNSNPELTCFPILEDPESSEEDINNTVNPENRFESTVKNIAVQCENSMAPEAAVDQMVLKSVSTEVMRNSSSTSDNREPYCESIMENESSLALEQAVERYSQGSVSTKISIQEIDDFKKSSMGQGRSRQIRPGKENKSISVVTTDNKSRKHSKTLSSRSSKPKLSGHSCLRSRGQSRGQSVSEKEQKHNNIVCSIKSFVPLVQQKQAAIPEKRDLKVKALQAAEAAKRAAEKRENERNQKKEALKLERARVEQEKMKEEELKKKLKEEQRKKREAENAAKKRQREEEQQKEKEQKKRRIEYARLQQKQAEEKLNAWKEESRCAAEDERAHHEKDSDKKTENKVGKENEGDLMKPVNDSAVVGNDQRETDVGLSADNKLSVGSSAAGKMGKIDLAENLTPNIERVDKPINQTSQSYELSPYRDSDDEEEEEDDEMPNKKFVPSWASKTCVISALSSLQYLNPDVIFPPGSFCSMDEVLLPRRLQQK